MCHLLVVRRPHAKLSRGHRPHRARPYYLRKAAGAGINPDGGPVYGYVVASPAKTGVNFRLDRAHRAGTTAARRDCRSRCIGEGRFRQPAAGHDLTDQPARLDRGP